MAIPKPNFVYIGRKPCGCCTAVISDLAGFEKDTAKDVAAVIKSGRAIERVSFEQYKTTVRFEPTFMACPHSKPVPAPSPQPGLFGAEVG